MARFTRVLGALALAIAVPAHGAFGDRDCSFGLGGERSGIHNAFGRVIGASLEPDGNVLLQIGMSTAALPYRMSPDGQSVTLLGFGGGELLADAAPVAAGQGRVLVATGIPPPIHGQPAGVVRLQEGGGFDRAFGANGIGRVPGLRNAAAGPLLQPDGRIVIGGSSTQPHSALARLNSDGTLDASFGSGGLVTNPDNFRFISIALQPDGKILAVDYGSNVWRYLPNGALDGTFGTGGVADLTGLLADSWAWIRVLPSGQILVAGTHPGGSNGLRLIRLNTNGSVDLTAAGGLGYRDVATPAGPLYAEYHPLKPIAVMADGRVLVTGATTRPPDAYRGAIVRYDLDFEVEAYVALEQAASFVLPLPSGKLLTENGTNGPTVRQLLGDLDAPNCTETSTSLSVFPSPSKAGQPVTLTAIVTAASGAATPDGLVTFSDYSQAIGNPVTLVPVAGNPRAASAQIVAANLDATIHQFTARYSGSSSFAPTSSAPSIHLVGAPLTIGIGDPSVAEGAPGITLLGFRVTLSAASSQSVAVDYATSNGTAVAGIDYVAQSGTLTFPPGITQRWVLVSIAGNTIVDSNRTVAMNLSNAAGAIVTKAQGIGTIIDDDPATAAAPVAMLRLYSPVTLEHLYTTDANEYSVLGTQGWVQEGTAYTMFGNAGTHGAQYAVPLYRLYHAGIQQHHWTTDPAEATGLAALGSWDYEGIPGYVLPLPGSGTRPLYRLMYSSPPLHLWTTDATEKDALSTQFGWVYEGVVGEVLP